MIGKFDNHHHNHADDVTWVGGSMRLWNFFRLVSGHYDEYDEDNDDDANLVFSCQRSGTCVDSTAPPSLSSHKYESDFKKKGQSTDHCHR